MPFFRCGGSTLSTIAKSQVLETLRTYCGNNFTLSATWKEQIDGNIDGLGDSSTSSICIISHTGFNELSNFFTSLYNTFHGIISYTSTVPGSVEGSPYYHRWGILWRSLGSNGGTRPESEQTEGYSGNITPMIFNLQYTANISNISKFDKKMLDSLGSIIGTGGSGSMTISNKRGERSLSYNIPSWLPNLFEEAGYEVTLPSNYKSVYNDNNQYESFGTVTSTFLSANYVG